MFPFEKTYEVGVGGVQDTHVLVHRLLSALGENHGRDREPDLAECREPPERVGRREVRVREREYRRLRLIVAPFVVDEEPQPPPEESELEEPEPSCDASQQTMRRRSEERASTVLRRAESV